MRLSRIASTGDTFDARLAGAYALTMVTRMPTNRQAITADGPIWSDVVGRPVEDVTALRTAAIPMPAAKPTSAPMSPTTNASRSTERVTCLRLAPIALSRANSRTRWATIIEKVL